ncbi:MAG: heme exporter protein CcmB [Acidobacteriaceae bacterium]|nr:heme exporter protein CcmB [Acidobacteriaceae bacterium]
MTPDSYTASIPNWVPRERGLASSMRTLRQALSVARKDLAIEFRTKESLNAAGAFAIVILLLFSFAFDPAADATREIGGGLLWLVFAFAGALVFNRGFARELPNECLDALLSSPLSAASLLLGKAMASFVLLLGVELVSMIVFGIFYDMRWWAHPAELAAVFVLATWGIAALGAVFGALTVNLRLRELMLPVIIYPLLIPLLIAAIELTNALFGTQPLTPDQLLWGRVLVVFDIVFTALAFGLAETILVN